MSRKKVVKAAIVPSVYSSVTSGTSNIYVKVNTPEFASISVDLDGEQVEDTSADGSCMDICNSGMQSILDLTDQQFLNTIALLTKVREEFSKLKKV